MLPVETVKLLLFFSAVVFELVYILLFVLTIKLPRFRFWPPPRALSWQFFLAWIMAGVVVVNAVFLGLLDFDFSSPSGLRVRVATAMVFFVVGSAIGTWASLVFGLKSVLGLGDKLIVAGPYRYTRNPQYIGDSLNAIGYMILVNSWMVWIIGALGVCLNILAPFTEEPWLAERFGDSYLEYKRRVPRFIGKLSTNGPRLGE